MSQPVFVSMSLQLSLLRFSHRDSSHGDYVPAPVGAVSEASMWSRAAAMAKVTTVPRKRQRDSRDEEEASHIPAVTVTPPDTHETTTLLYPSIRWWLEQATRQRQAEGEDEVVAARVSQQLFRRRFGVVAAETHHSGHQDRPLIPESRGTQAITSATLVDDRNAQSLNAAAARAGTIEDVENREDAPQLSVLRNDEIAPSSTTAVAASTCPRVCRRITLEELVPSCRRCLSRALLVLLSPRVAPLVEATLMEHDPRPSGKTVFSLAPRCPDVLPFSCVTYTVMSDGLVLCGGQSCTSFEAAAKGLFRRGVCAEADRNVDLWFWGQRTAAAPAADGADEADDARASKSLGIAASTRSCIRFVGLLAILQRVAFVMSGSEADESSPTSDPDSVKAKLAVTLSVADDPSAVPALVEPRSSDCGPQGFPKNVTWLNVTIGDGTGARGVGHVALSLSTADDNVLWWCSEGDAQQPETSSSVSVTTFGRGLSAFRRAIAASR